MAQFSFIPVGESPDIAQDLRAVFEELAASLAPEQRAISGECHPALDVFETDEHVAIVMDAAGISPAAVRIVFRGDVVIIAGEKAPPPASGQEAFHLIEREFGRFARAVRLSGAFDVRGSRARLHEGELSVILPKLTERRGRAHRIPVEAGAPA